MAAKPVEGTQTIENEETPGDCSGKKKSKFQAFKKLFVKKKRKESPAPSGESNLKPSQSSSDVSVSGPNESAFQPAHESVAKSSMGSKAVSHDSVFISEVENSTKEDTSQENTAGKVKALQLQLQQNIRIGSPPQGILSKKVEDSGALSEDDGLPRSPPEITSLHEILALSSGKTPGIAQRRSSLSLGGTDSEDEPESCETSSCPISPLNSSILLSSNSPGSHYLIDFTAPPNSVACLDNSAAKHKIAVKPKKRRGPVMSIHRIKDGTGIAKDLHIKLKEKTENQAHDVHIPYTGESSAEQEVPKEQAKCIEDKIEETETDAMSLAAQEEDSSVEKTKTYGTCFTGTQIMSLPDETDESDVDFHASGLTVEDQVNGNEEDTEIERTSTGVPHISQSAPVHELNEATAQLEPSEMEDNAVETVCLEVSEDVECDIFEDPLKIQQNTLAFETDEPIFNDKHQEHNDYGKVLPDLTELQKDLSKVTACTSDTRVISSPQKHIATESDTSIIKVDKRVPNVASKCVLIFESTDNEKTSETLQESSTNATTDQPTIIDTLSTDEKVETFGLRIIETPKDISVDDGHSKCSTCSINLGSGANSSADIQYTNEYSTEPIKPTDSNVDSKLRTSNKPIRFTVAPAWQRSLSVGGSVKDTTYSKKKISNTMKSESFDGSEDPGMGINQEDYRKGENKEDSGVAFGVRLRRTSSSRKYNEEYPEEQSKLYPSPVEIGSMVPIQAVPTPTKTAQLQTETSKASKPSHTVEDKPRQKQKAEDLSSHESSEPAWITMAKLKQKGFQDHPLARELSAMAESDKSEGDGESSQKRSTAASLQELEVKVTEPISTESPVIQNCLPESGKNAQSAPPQNPDEPPWFSLAKKKAKAWSKMPQIVQ